MAVQPQPGAGVRQLAGPGRGRRQGPAGVAGGAWPLPLHLRPAVPAARRLAPTHRAGGPEVGADLLRQGLGAEVLAQGRDGLPLLAGGVAGTSELTQTLVRWGDCFGKVKSATKVGRHFGESKRVKDEISACQLLVKL